MSSYGRNFEFRVPPVDGQRESRWATRTDQAAVLIGAPVVADFATTPGSLGLPCVTLAAADAPRAGGNKGIAVYEWGPNAWAGNDPSLTTYSDKDFVPQGAAVQVVHGSTVKVCLRNTVARTFLNVRAYPGRVFVNLTGLAAGNFLTPGAGNDTDGYWKKTTTEANAWLVVTSIDTARAEVEARMLF